jgi:cell division septum initiation protein DivIVA
MLGLLLKFLYRDIQGFLKEIKDLKQKIDELSKKKERTIVTNDRIGKEKQRK